MDNTIGGRGIWVVYLLECSDRTLYAGITNDLDRRLRCHLAGKAARYTRGRLPVLLVYHERCTDRPSALRREYAVKRLTRREKLALIRNAERR